MSRIQDSIEVEVPVSTAYGQWTQFESFPQFMDNVDRVVQLDDTTLEWTATIGGQAKTWRAKIIEQVPDRRIAWVSTSGARNDGVVTFEALGPERTQVSLGLDVEPEGPVEHIGDALGIVKKSIQDDLGKFKAFIESRGVETGAWRGSVNTGTRQ
ncbi:MAG: cyclase [Chloroflexi bacterium RBG_16_72_14]|nr:MAG: cyclase [Chloroflexi bacterium RBG_16_72_14]